MPLSRHRSATIFAAVLAAAGTAGAADTQTGPSSSQSPYVIPVAPGASSISLLTAGDSIGGYRMVGTPDGLGAYDNGDGTFTLLVNHEITNADGVTRAHGANGAFVSEWVINKNTFQVLSGADLIKNVYGWDVTNQKLNDTTSTVTFTRFCSADLAPVSAFYNPGSGLGTTNRIYMNGEEGGANGFLQATVATGAAKGSSYTLGKFDLNLNGSADAVAAPSPLTVTAASTASNSVTLASVPGNLAVGATLLGQKVTAINTGTKVVTLAGNANANIAAATPAAYTLAGVGAWENALANPLAQDKTVVIANSDGGTGLHTNALAVYVGTKTGTGTDADRAGLTNGVTKFVNVTGFASELANTTTRTTGITSGTPFTLSPTASTTFSRPEDGAWNPANPSQYFFVTTDQIDKTDLAGQTQKGGTRLWRLNFSDITNPDAGGTIDLLIDSTTFPGGIGNHKPNMFDNISANADGTITILEDVGNNEHNGKVWLFNPITSQLSELDKFDPSRFGDIDPNTGAFTAGTHTKDEETSGVIDITSILNRGDGKTYLLLDAQDHALASDLIANGFMDPNASAAEIVEGGQLLVVATPEPASLGVLAAGAAGLMLRRRRK